MRRKDQPVSRPGGGLRAGATATRAWHWNGPGELLSAPVRCKKEQWYLARGKLAGAAHPERTDLYLRFQHRDQMVSERTLSLHAVAERGADREVFGWVQAPDDATHLQLRLRNVAQASLFEEVVFHPVVERDATCHPLANVPRWSIYRPPFPLERVVLPPGLECLGELLTGREVKVVRPRSKSGLARQIRGAACVLDPAWAVELGLQWADLERLAADSWLVVDLETLWKLVRRSVHQRAQLVTERAPHGIMSARVEYADVATRGFALQDVFPYGTIDAEGGFAARVLRADRAWKRYADQQGFATLLSSETPSPKHCGDVLSAARPLARGELIATDLPWLVAGQHGPLLAPRLARHALRMHLGETLDDNVQYWNRWEDSQYLVRDISDLERRYPPLRAVRWASADDSVVHLGVALPATRGSGTGTSLIIATGRIDHAQLHDGLPPEPMTIFMKMLTREVREQTAWAARHLRDLTVIWQFDAAVGLRYAANYASAAAWVSGTPRTVTLVRADTPGSRKSERAASGARVEAVTDHEGLLGDGSLEFQAHLTARLRRLIERESGRTPGTEQM